MVYSIHFNDFKYQADWFTLDECWGHLKHTTVPYVSTLTLRKKQARLKREKGRKVKGRNKIKQSKSTRIDMERCILSMK